VVASSNQLRGGSPVRIAGVDVGKVVGIEPGPVPDTSTVVLELEERGRPIHRDATLRIRSRVFLEGGFYVDLQPGTGAAPELADGGTLPLPQTAGPVQFHQLLSVFEQPVVESLRGGVGALAHGLEGGGAEGLRQAAPNLAPALRDTAIVADAAQGTEPHDVSRLIRGASRLTGALAADRRALADLVTNLRRSADALSADDSALAESIAELDGLLRLAPAGLRALDGVLPVVERVSRQALPAIAVAPRSLRGAGRVIDQIGSLVEPSVRDRTIDGLATTFVDLPTLVVNMGSLFPTTKGLADCLRTHIVPVLRSEIDDGALSSGYPVYLDFAHSLVGLASATQNFDANGYNTRYLFGLGNETFSTDALAGVGQLVGESDGPLQTRPVPPPGNEPPPIRRDVECTTQPLPDLAAEVGPG
jgi:phospholipid/cholesterol/gamma-HCH transport system substrate-binding protein